MPDGQGVWHYDDEVNICNTYIWLFPTSTYLYVYISIYILYLWPSCICHLKCVSLLLLCCCCCCFFIFISLVFVVCCLWYRSSGSFDFLVSLLCCELIQSGVVGSGWSFFSFVPVRAWRIVLTMLIFCWFFRLVVLVFFLLCVLFFQFHIFFKYNMSVYLYRYNIFISVCGFSLNLMFSSRAYYMAKSPRAKYRLDTFPIGSIRVVPARLRFFLPPHTVSSHHTGSQ